MAPRSVIIKQVEYPRRMDWDLAMSWAEGIPSFNENDPSHPEWRATPTMAIDLSSEGYDVVYVKDEGDARSNPTQTIKDRAGCGLALYMQRYDAGKVLPGAKVLIINTGKGI